MPVRKFVFLKRKRSVSWDQFSNHWKGPHATLIAGLPQFWEKYTERYIQNHVQQRAVPPVTEMPIWDGVVETTQRARADLEQGFWDDPDYINQVRPDELSFIEIEQSLVMLATEHVVIDGPRRGAKLFIMPRRNPDLSLEEFHRYWFEHHGEEAKRHPVFGRYLKRYVQHHVIPGSVRSMTGHPGYDGIGEYWFDSVEDMVAAYTAPSYMSDLRSDERRFVLNPPSPRLVVDEIEIPRP